MKWSLLQFGILGGILSIILVVFAGLLVMQSKEIYNQSIQPAMFSYNDSTDRGHSTIEAQLKQGIISAVYKLDSGFQWPYVAVGLTLGKDSTDFLKDCPDWSSYDSLVLHIRSAKASGLTLQLSTKIPAGRQAGPSEKYRLLQQTMSISPRWRRIAVSLQDFSIPVWWKKEHGLPLSEGDHFLESTCKFELVSSGYLDLGVSDTLELKEAHLEGKRVWPILLVATVLTSFWLVFLLLWNRKRIVEKVKREQRLKEYQPLEVKNQGDRELDQLLEYLQTHYQNAEVSSEMVARETGLSRRRVGELLKESVDMTLKAYLNHLRLKEATRLLTESDLQIVQIAYEVGYNTVSHFNRVFKDKFEVSPKEYRSKNLK